MITATSETPTASRSGRPKPRVSRGTSRTPPPRPRSEPNSPAAAPPPTINRPTTTSAADSARRGADPSDQQCRSGSEVLGCVGQQGDVPGTLEGDRQLALVTGAGAGLAARLDLGALGQVAAEAVDLLVVDLRGLVGAERADLATAAIAIEVIALLGTDRRHGSLVSWSEREVVEVGVVGRRTARSAAARGCGRSGGRDPGERGVVV